MSSYCNDASTRSVNLIETSTFDNGLDQAKVNGLYIGDFNYWPPVEEKTWANSDGYIKYIPTTFFFSRLNQRFAQIHWNADPETWRPVNSDWVYFSGLPSAWTPYIRQWGALPQLPGHSTTLPGGKFSHICVDPSYQIQTYDYDGLAEVAINADYQWGAGGFLYKLY